MSHLYWTLGRRKTKYFVSSPSFFIHSLPTFFFPPSTLWMRVGVRGGERPFQSALRVKCSSRRWVVRRGGGGAAGDLSTKYPSFLRETFSHRKAPRWDFCRYWRRVLVKVSTTPIQWEDCVLVLHARSRSSLPRPHSRLATPCYPAIQSHAKPQSAPHRSPERGHVFVECCGLWSQGARRWDCLHSRQSRVNLIIRSLRAECSGLTSSPNTHRLALTL